MTISLPVLISSGLGLAIWLFAFKVTAPSAVLGVSKNRKIGQRIVVASLAAILLSMGSYWISGTIIKYNKTKAAIAIRVVEEKIRDDEEAKTLPVVWRNFRTFIRNIHYVHIGGDCLARYDATEAFLKQYEDKTLPLLTVVQHGLFPEYIKGLLVEFIDFEMEAGK